MPGSSATTVCKWLSALLFCSVAVATACTALTTAQSGVQSGVGGVQSASGTGDQVKQLGTSAKDLVTGKKKEEDGEGDDDDRLHAKEAQINTPLNDKVDNATKGKKDKDDWRKFQLAGKPGVATFELFWDDETANLDIDVYDSFGVNVGKSPPRMEGQSVKRILVQIRKAGTYYVRVRAPTEKDKSIYTLNVKWEGPPVPIKQADATPPPQPQTGTPPGPPTAGTPYSLLTDPNKLQGNVISAYRDGAGWVLHIDKGAAASIHSGMTGVILEGNDGEQVLDKGDFTISQVVDAGHSIARTALPKSPGKNKRVLINLR
jgi:hypothetical protein